jgi:hypothetical protein
MEPIIVSNQNEYDQAEKTFRDILDNSRFDIEAGKGLSTIEEVETVIHNHLKQGVSKDEAEKSLSQYNFTESQALKIISYFSNHYPKDLHDIESGLNFIGMKNSRELNLGIPLIHIKEASEKICVWSPVEVFGKSEIEALEHAKTIAHDRARVGAHNRAIVEALDHSFITAFNQSNVVARNYSRVVLHNESTAIAHNYSKVEAGDHANIALFDNSVALVTDSAIASAYHNALITASKNATIFAFNDAKVKAFENCRVTLRNRSYVQAHNFAFVDAQDQTVTIADNNAKVSAKDNSLVFLKDYAICGKSDKAKVIPSNKNTPSLFKKNLFAIYNHPFINGDASAAINLLLAAVNKEDKAAFGRKLKKMGFVDLQSFHKALNGLTLEFEQKLYEKLKQRDARERQGK